MGKARRKEKDVPSVPCQEEPKLYLESALLEVTVPEVKIKELVDLPYGLEYNEWLASHTLSFFDHISLIYGTVSEFCTMSICPDMIGPANRQYLWFDEKGKKCKVASPQYIDYVMTFTQKTVNDESIFPTKFDRDFPSSFESVVKKIHTLLFHVLAHLYHSHFREVVLLNLHAHLNCLFAHFLLFSEQFKLLDEKDSEVLRDLAVALKLVANGDLPPQVNDAKLENQGEPKSSKDFEGSASGDYNSVQGSPARSDKGADIKDYNVLDKNRRSVSPTVASSSTVLPSTTAVTSSPVSLAGSVTASATTQQPQPCVPSTITALHTRSTCNSHANSSSCAMDSTLHSATAVTQTPCGSSPIKFQ